jgi:hypothetical protein
MRLVAGFSIVSLTSASGDVGRYAVTQLMAVPFIAALLFLIGAICNLFTGDHANAAAGLGVAAGLIGLSNYMSTQEGRRAAFLTWLLEHESEMLEHPFQSFHYNDDSFSYSSYVTQYSFCTSFLFATFREHTRFFPEDSPDRRQGAFVASLLSLVFGWWGLPWGPVYTVQTLYKNVNGGETLTIRDVLHRMADTADP